MRALRNDTLDTRTAVALAALALGFGMLGALGVASADFAYQWQPVPPDVPARGALALAVGLLEVVAAAMLAIARLRSAGAWLAAALLLGWTALTFRRCCNAPRPSPTGWAWPRAQRWPAPR